MERGESMEKKLWLLESGVDIRHMSDVKTYESVGEARAAIKNLPLSPSQYTRPYRLTLRVYASEWDEGADSVIEYVPTQINTCGEYQAIVS